MRHDLTVSKSIVINAEPSKVWSALTNPEIIKEYLFGTETITDWKVGSDIIFQGEYQGQNYRDHGVIAANTLNKILSYTYWTAFAGLEDLQDNYSLMIYSLWEKDKNHTELTWTQIGFSTEEGHKHSEGAFDEILAKIKAIVER